MTSPRPVPIFDGHNDVLLRLYRRGGTDVPRAFLEGETKGQLDLPMARQGGFDAAPRLMPSGVSLYSTFGGCTVLVIRPSRSSMWRRVGEDEANPSRGTISHVSPLARALLENALANLLKPGIVMQRYETSDDL